MSQSQQLPSISKLLTLDNFRKRTPMYIGDRTITTLYNFLNGLYYAIDAYQIEDPELPDFNSFNDWIASHYNWPESTAGWKNIILKECQGNEETALSKFFQLYDQFILET